MNRLHQMKRIARPTMSSLARSKGVAGHAGSKLQLRGMCSFMSPDGTSTSPVMPPAVPPSMLSSWSSQQARFHNRLDGNGAVRSARPFSTAATASDDHHDENGSNKSDDDSPLNAPREQMAFDVLIVGGGPAGLAAAIRLKQLCQKDGQDLSVCVIEKGSEIGAHILSGNVFDPKALLELFPDEFQDGNDHWSDVMLAELPSSHQAMPTRVTDDQFRILASSTSGFTVPNVLLPSQLHNTNGNYIISLSQMCRWLGQRAEALGVEVYAGFAASEVLYYDGGDDQHGDGSATSSSPMGVRGIATRDVGIGKDGEPKSTFERGVELVARQTIFAEGARGSCSESIMKELNLREGAGSSSSNHPQTYGLGIKEVWEVNPESKHFQPGLVQHTVGFPLQSSIFDKIFGGSFIYHQKPNLVLVGTVVGLDYENPYINPYKEFQLLKTHDSIRPLLEEEESTCISYGARVLNEGGYHSVPQQLSFPGGALIGCSAGFLNAVKIKGTHTAMKSGMVAAETIFKSLLEETSQDGSPDEAAAAQPVAVAETGELDPDYVPHRVKDYDANMKQSWVYEELYQVRNVHQAFSKWGIGIGMVYTGIATHITKGREPWTLSASTSSDADNTKPSLSFDEGSISGRYAPADNKVTFDLLTNLQRSNTYHEEDQPAHLRIKPGMLSCPRDVSLQTYAGPEQRFCPASVYEYVNDTSGGADPSSSDAAKQKLVINAQNCIHCKCCSIKMPKEYIDWTVPEGGGGPQYQIM